MKTVQKVVVVVVVVIVVVVVFLTMGYVIRLNEKQHTKL